MSGIGNAYAGPAIGPLLAAGVSQRSLARAVAVLISVMQAGDDRRAGDRGSAAGGRLARPRTSSPGVCAACGGGDGVAGSGRHRPRPRAASTRRPSPTRLAGARFIFATPALLGAISLDLMAVLFGGATALLPIFSQTILHVGAFGNGLLRAAPGIGAVVVGSVLSGQTAATASGPNAADRGGAVRGVHGRVRALHELRAVDGGSGGAGRRRRDLDVHPGHARAAAHAAGSARPGERGGTRIHRCLKRAGGIRIRRRRGTSRCRAGRALGRYRLDCGGGHLGVEIPGCGSAVSTHRAISRWPRSIRGRARASRPPGSGRLHPPPARCRETHAPVSPRTGRRGHGCCSYSATEISIGEVQSALPHSHTNGTSSSGSTPPASSSWARRSLWARNAISFFTSRCSRWLSAPGISDSLIARHRTRPEIGRRADRQLVPH